MQLESGVSKIEIGGGSITEILKANFNKSTIAEIKYLQKYAHEYGYKLDGNTWVKTGDWRASETGRLIAGSAGPVTDIFEVTTDNYRDAPY